MFGASLARSLLVAGLAAALPGDAAAAPQSEAGPIGGNFKVGSGFWIVGSTPYTSSAYDPASRQWLVVWDWLANTNPTPGGRLLQREGEPVGDVLTFAGQAGISVMSRVSVASLSGGSTRWVMVGGAGSFTGNWLALVAIQADGTWIASQPFGTTDIIRADVAGGPSESAALVALNFAATGVVRVASIEPGGIVHWVRDVDTGVFSESVRVSDAGAGRRHLVTWEKGGDVMAVLADRSGVEAGPFVVSADPAVAETRPAVAGDGVAQWLVAYERPEGGAERDIVCRTVAVQPPNQIVVGDEVPLAAEVARDEERPVVAWLQESYLVAYRRDFGGGDYDVWTRSVSGFDCSACEPPQQLSAAALPDAGVDVATGILTFGGAEASVTWIAPQGLNSWEPTIVRTRRYLAEDGKVGAYGGGCVGGGIASVHCARVGGTLGLRTQFAAPGAAGALLLGGNVVTSIGCGPCSLRIANVVVAVPVLTDANGDASVAVPLTDPALVGGGLLAQWVVAGNGGCAGVLSLSDGLSVLIQ